MNDIRFGWISESRRITLRSLMAAMATDWSRAWWVHHSSAEVDVQSLDRDGFAAGEPMPFVSHNASGSLALFLGHRGVDTIGRHLAGAPSDDDQGWSKRIGEDALEDLTARIFARAGITEVERLLQAPATVDLEQDRLGTYAMAFSLGRLQLGVSIDRRLVDRLVPPSMVQEGHLESRQAALGSAQLSIHAVIDFGSVSLTQLSDLHVGEVLVGDRELDEPLAICLDDQKPIATAYLRRSGPQRAIVLYSTHNHEKQDS